MTDGVEAGSGDPGLAAGEGRVWGDGPGGGSASVKHGTPGPTPPAANLFGGTPAEEAAIWARFVDDYLGLLDERVAVISEHAMNDPVRARTAVLSLSTASSMIDAKGLVQILNRIRRTMETGERATFAGLVDELRDEAEVVHARLSGADQSV